MATTRCYYEVLNVERTASGDEVKRAIPVIPKLKPHSRKRLKPMKCFQMANAARLTTGLVVMVFVQDQAMISEPCMSKTSSRCLVTSSVEDSVAAVVHEAGRPHVGMTWRPKSSLRLKTYCRVLRRRFPSHAWMSVPDVREQVPVQGVRQPPAPRAEAMAR